MTAYITIENGYFRYYIPDIINLKFKIAYSARRLEKVIFWDNTDGYLEAETLYMFDDNNIKVELEYYDIGYILTSLGFELSEYCNNITEVKII